MTKLSSTSLKFTIKIAESRTKSRNSEVRDCGMASSVFLTTHFIEKKPLTMQKLYSTMHECAVCLGVNLMHERHKIQKIYWITEKSDHPHPYMYSEAAMERGEYGHSGIKVVMMMINNKS